MVFLKNKKTVVFVILSILGGGSLFLTVSKKQPALEKVQNFEDCLEAGYFLITSRPRQCKTPDGQVFVEKEKEKETKTPKEEEIKAYTDPDQLIEVQPGENFQIRLGSNPSTGYRWEFEADTSLVVPLRQEFRPESDLLGAGGIEIFEFSASSSGEAEIKFFYHRPWEEKPIEAEVFKIKIL